MEYPVPVVPSIGVPATKSFLILKIGYSWIGLTSPLCKSHISWEQVLVSPIELASLVVTYMTGKLSGVIANARPID